VAGGSFPGQSITFVCQLLREASGKGYDCTEEVRNLTLGDFHPSAVDGSQALSFGDQLDGFLFISVVIAYGNSLRPSGIRKFRLESFDPLDRLAIALNRLFHLLTKLSCRAHAFLRFDSLAPTIAVTAFEPSSGCSPRSDCWAARRNGQELGERFEDTIELPVDLGQELFGFLHRR
jgi:hypothetical protein